MKTDQLIVVYDGWCNMCSLLVRWLSAANKRDRLVLISQQSYIDLFPDQKDTIDHLHLNDELVVRRRNGVVSTGADAVLLILQALGGGYKLLKAFFQLFPQIFLNKIYGWVAHHRYRFLGRRKSCHIHPPLP